MVQQVGEVSGLLGLVDGSVGGAVDDAVDVVVVDELVDGLAVGDVELGDISIIIGVLGMLLLQPLHLVAQLAVTARNQNIHELLTLNYEL